MKQKTFTKPACFFLLLTMLFVSLNLKAQDTRSNVSGIVRNEKGENLSNATVSVKNVKSGFTASSQTDSNGVFHFSGLPSGGAYSFTFSFIGYLSQTLNGYTLKPDATLSIIVNLKNQENTLNDIRQRSVK